MTERHQLQEQLVRQANTDALTSVGNRSWLMGELSLALQATPAAPLSVLVIELQGLREVDESLGLMPGDRILVDVAEHLAKTLRHGDRLARVDSGDFAVLLPDTTPARAAAVAHRLRAALPSEFVLDGAPVAISLCVGQANSRGGIDAEHASEAATRLLRNATLPMAAARRSPDGVALYVSAMSERARRRLELHGALQEAIGRGELSLAYQPQVDLSQGSLCGVEALVRWTHPSLGEISPVEFVPIAEDTGLAVELGTWVLQQACEQAAWWSRDLAAPLGVSVNVSGLQLMDAGIAATLSEVLRTTGLDPRLLTLEITESVLIGDAAAAIERLRAIRSLGVQIAVDDFGTGYSSLSSLTRFPVDELKVDRSFVSPLPDDPATHRVTRSIVELAHGLGLRTVGEGIETRPQLDALTALGCDVGQGYLFARPLSAEAIPTWRP